MNAQEKQHIEQRKYGITVAQVAQLVANRDGDAAAYAANTARIATNHLATSVAQRRYTHEQLNDLEAVHIFLNRIQLALTDLEGSDLVSLATWRNEQ